MRHHLLCGDVYKRQTPYCVKKVAVLNCWGKMRAWGNHMVHHAIYYKQNYSYAGIIEALSGAPFDVKFISFDDIRKDASILDDIDVILNAVSYTHLHRRSCKHILLSLQVDCEDRSFFITIFVLSRRYRR